MAPITINGNTVDPVEQAPQMNVKGLMMADATKSNYILVQTLGKLSKDQKEQLVTKGALIKEYVSENTYLLEYRPTDLHAIRNIDFVQWANVYNKEFKVHSSLKTISKTRDLNILSDDVKQQPSSATHRVDIVFHEGVDVGSNELLSSVAEAARVGQDDMDVGTRQIRVMVQQDRLTRLAAIDGVRSINEVHEMKLSNNIARGILKADASVGEKKYRGEGQVVAVADTGFDLGSTDDTHPAFTGRVLKLYPTRPRWKKDDPDGHGTHVAGSVLGDGKSNEMGGVIQGAAPAAKLALQSLGSNEMDEDDNPYIGLGGIPSDLRTLFREVYDDVAVKARIHTNSWGPGQTGLPYTNTEAFEVDDFIWRKQDMVILFAAGNEGADKNADGRIEDKQIGLYAAAKNSITVGASENNRPEIKTLYGQFRDDRGIFIYRKFPINSDAIANNPDGMAAFSNRGYTPEGRIKPDVVAPGTAILSAASRHPTVLADEDPNSKDPDWRFMSGTSMATPLVAGCCAVIREVLSKEAGLQVIPAALVKALIINGADELKGQYPRTEAGPSPNTSSGWGIVNLSNSTDTSVQSDNGGFVIGKELEDDEEYTDTISIPSIDGLNPSNNQRGRQAPLGGSGPNANHATLKITLVWTDPPGVKLQNDLDLIVVGSNGVEYHGNMGETKENYDRSNNVEQIVWKNMPAGEAKVTVRAESIVRFKQPFAYAWRIIHE
ncbi:hypothetical protein V500_04963 [Pseudogymnoascus sp. VKM F-4518 (FW-2643)]|nr:hypothetical protein V500_04963 [Pseudogymnoascus sp. VKM F-4518 (FW-2643)]